MATKLTDQLRQTKDSINISNENLSELVALSFIGNVFSGDDRGVIVAQDIKQLLYMCQAPANITLHSSACSIVQSKGSYELAKPKHTKQIFNKKCTCKPEVQTYKA